MLPDSAVPNELYINISLTRFKLLITFEQLSWIKFSLIVLEFLGVEIATKPVSSHSTCLSHDIVLKRRKEAKALMKNDCPFFYTNTCGFD